jgi:hypothetical protein
MRICEKIEGNVRNDPLGSKFASRVIVQRALGRFPLGSTRHPLGGQAFTPLRSAERFGCARSLNAGHAVLTLRCANPDHPPLIHPPPSRPLSSLAITCHGFGRYDRNTVAKYYICPKIASRAALVFCFIGYDLAFCLYFNR